MTNPDFVALARSMRVHAIHCETAAELPQKMKEFLEYDNSKPVLMEVVVEKNEHVFPMVRPDAFTNIGIYYQWFRFRQAKLSTNNYFTQNYGPFSRIQYS
jgi:acetolactate synthase I/II/III large subunit